MATIIVKDTAGLKAALQSAAAGDTIKLAAGDYSSFTLNNLKFSGAGVTITSLDTTHEARLSSFELRGCEGITFREVELAADVTKVNPFQIFDSARITLDKLFVHGTMDDNAQNDPNGVLIRGSSNVAVTNSEFTQLETGVTHADSKGVIIDGNKFSNLQEDGVRGGGTSQIRVTNNVFTNFDPVDGDHPDAIQFWTRNTTASATDITVSGNLILRGDGAATQGIFFRDQVGNLPFKNVAISDNLVVGSAVTGITVSGAEDVQVANNIVAALPGQPAVIGLLKVSGAQLTGNQASSYNLTTVTNLTNTSTTLAPLTDGGAALVTAFVAAHPLLLQYATTTSLLNLVDTALANIEDTRINAQVIEGTSGNDQLRTLLDRDTRLEGGAGNDLLDSSGVGHNTLVGGAGDDTYRLTSSYDVVVEEVGGGYDQVTSSVNVTLSENIERLTLTGEARQGVGNSTANSISGSTGADTLSGMGGDDNVSGKDGDDRIFGGDGADSVYGGNGDDTIAGDDGSDRLRGDAGNDSLSGGGGADTIDGSVGSDILAGGAGADQFVYGNLEAAGESIFDFSRTEGDKVNLAALDANSVLANNQAFTFIGTAAFSKVAGQLRYEVSGSDSYVLGDYNGDGLADFKFLMKNVTSLQSSDFLL